MIDPNKDFKSGDYYLFGYNGWMLWVRLSNHGPIDRLVIDSDATVFDEPTDRLVIDSDATVFDEPEDLQYSPSGVHWKVEPGMSWHPVAPEDVDGVIMAARHMTQEQWSDFAARMAAKQAEISQVT